MNDINLIPLGIMLFISVLGLGASIQSHGDIGTEPKNVWVNIIGFIITWGLIVWMIW